MHFGGAPKFPCRRPLSARDRYRQERQWISFNHQSDRRTVDVVVALNIFLCKYEGMMPFIRQLVLVCLKTKSAILDPYKKMCRKHFSSVLTGILLTLKLK